MRFLDSKIFTVEKLSPRKEKTPEGFLLCKEVPISRTGGFEYSPGMCGLKPGADGRCIVSRTEEELFNPDTIASFEGKPVVIGHETFVDPSNWKSRSIGILKNVRRGEGDQSDQLLADLLITDQKGIDLVESGVYEEVSCGYDAQVVADGDGRGHIRGIVGNHLAIVKEGRCGSTCRIMDGKMTFSLKNKIRRLFRDGNEEGLNEVLDNVEVSEKDADESTPAAPETDKLSLIESQIAELQKAVQVIKAFMEKSTEEIADEDETEEEKKDGEEKEVTDEDDDAKPVTEEEAQKTIADAEELCPGVKKPTADSKDGFTVGTLERLKRNAIKQSGLREFADGIDSASGDLLDAYFKGALGIVRARNNPKAVQFGDSATPSRVVRTNKELNDSFKNFWNKKE